MYKITPIDEKKADIEVTIKNCRESRRPFLNGYRPAFKVHSSYLTSGSIEFSNVNEVGYYEEAAAQVKLITPDVYPKSLWIGKKMDLQEGSQVVGYAIVTKIFNKILESDIIGVEGKLNL